MRVKCIHRWLLALRCSSLSAASPTRNAGAAGASGAADAAPVVAVPPVCSSRSLDAAMGLFLLVLEPHGSDRHSGQPYSGAIDLSMTRAVKKASVAYTKCTSGLERFGNCAPCAGPVPGRNFCHK